MSFIREAGEQGLIRWIADQHPDEAEGVILGIGDDAAGLSFTPGRIILASADSQVEGIHFRLAYCTPEQIGRKAAAVNLSDMAAMGGCGRYLLCQMGLPEKTDIDFFRRLTGGLLEYAREHRLYLVGGDLAASPGPLFLSVTILGEASPEGMITRGGARPGDLLVLSGFTGESGAGFRLLDRGKPPHESHNDQLAKLSRELPHSLPYKINLARRQAWICRV